MNAPMTGNAERVFAQFLELERQTRAAQSTEQLAYSLVNDGQPLFGYRHAALLIAGKVRAVTAVSSVDPNAPFVAFVEQAVAQLHKHGLGQAAREVPAAQLSEQVQADWQSLSAGHVFWLPLIDPQGRVFGGVWLARPATAPAVAAAPDPQASGADAADSGAPIGAGARRSGAVGSPSCGG